MPKPLEYDAVLRVDNGQPVRHELPFAIRAAGLITVLGGFAAAIFVTLQSV
jgi:hypothetical protein